MVSICQDAISERLTNICKIFAPLSRSIRTSCCERDHTLCGEISIPQEGFSKQHTQVILRTYGPVLCQPPFVHIFNSLVYTQLFELSNFGCTTP